MAGRWPCPVCHAVERSLCVAAHEAREADVEQGLGGSVWRRAGHLQIVSFGAGRVAVALVELPEAQQRAAAPGVRPRRRSTADPPVHRFVAQLEQRLGAIELCGAPIWIRRGPPGRTGRWRPSTRERVQAHQARLERTDTVAAAHVDQRVQRAGRARLIGVVDHDGAEALGGQARPGRARAQAWRW